MSEMVDRGAEAICKAIGEDWDECPELGVGFIPGHPSRIGKDDWRNMFRAAIEAMLKPTEAMIKAAEACDDYSTFGCPGTGQMHWEAMINAAKSD